MYSVFIVVLDTDRIVLVGIWSRHVEKLLLSGWKKRGSRLVNRFGNRYEVLSYIYVSHI